MKSFFKRLFAKKNEKKQVAVQESFAARFHRFKLFLGAHIEAYSEMMTFEERLAGQDPVGMPFFRVCTAKLTVSTMQCIRHLNMLSEGRFERLLEPFAELRARVQELLEAEPLVLEGPLIVPLRHVTEKHEGIIAPEIVKLEPIQRAHPELIPSGFVVTGVAWAQYFDNPAMRDEIDRIMIISQDDSGSYEEAAATIRERLLQSFPLPDNLKDELLRALQDVRENLAQSGWSLLIRCLPVRMEHRALVMPEQIINTPVTETDIDLLYSAVAKALAMTYRPRAMIYRLKLGIRDRAMPFCLCFTVLPASQARGSVHRKLDSLEETELVFHVRRTMSNLEGDPPQTEGAALPDEMMPEVERKCKDALVCVADAPVLGNRHEIYWAAAQTGEFYVVGVCALPDPEPLPPDNPAAISCSLPTAHGGHVTFPLCGGRSCYPGQAQGKAVVVRNIREALQFPIGGVLVVSHAAPRWSFLLDFASGAIAGDGSGNGFFAQTARRYGRPTILEQPTALDLLGEEQDVLVISSGSHESAVLLCPPSPCTVSETAEAPAKAKENMSVNQQASSGCNECDAYHFCQDASLVQLPSVAALVAEQGNFWISTSNIAQLARQFASQVTRLTLVDPDDPDFRAENCKTFHDFLTYAHDHAVREMFRHGTTRKSAQAPAKQLVCDVPKQFWIINLDDGYYDDITAPVVKLEEIASIPMRTLWEGFSDKPWDGPPQINAKGFLSVLFEATQNPNLDPASQHTQYTEKNVFLIAKRFCSMRCRFGFHFLSLDCFLSERPRERFIVFQFKGGAANLARRIRRVHFVAELLQHFGFSTEIVGDTLTARLEESEERTFLSALRVIGYLVMHTRQLDMIMTDEEALAKHRFQMLEDLLALAAREPMQLP